MDSHLKELEGFLKGVGFEQTYDIDGYWKSYLMFHNGNLVKVGLCQDGCHHVYYSGRIELIGDWQDVIDFVYELGDG